MHGALVIPGWAIDPVPENVRKEVWVLEAGALRAFMEREPIRLADAEVSRAAFALNDYIRSRERSRQRA